MNFTSGIFLGALVVALSGCAASPTALQSSVQTAAPSSIVEPRFVTSEFSLWDSAAFQQIAEDAGKVAPVKTWKISFARCDSLETRNGPVFLDGRDASNGWFVGAFNCSGDRGAAHNGFAGVHSSDWGARRHFDYVLGLKAQADAPAFDGFVLPATTDYGTLDIGFSRPGRYTVTLKPGFADPHAQNLEYNMTLYVGATQSWPVSATRTENLDMMSRKISTLTDSTVKGVPVEARW